ncbi:hypothetical protein JOB18_048996 [Solea senegalensis]|uniref:Uncharacterized protein n=1 Tax=Solea senegalensis TaxID=28829 RepID=A0AAV6S7H4_SOLSE|nr:hypothetical protein JOB18_048996 [Solea senegalensis]
MWSRGKEATETEETADLCFFSCCHHCWNGSGAGRVVQASNVKDSQRTTVSHT